MPHEHGREPIMVNVGSKTVRMWTRTRISGEDSILQLNQAIKQLSRMAPAYDGAVGSRVVDEEESCR